jgi:hypothetical protein
VTEIDHPFISSNLGAMVIRRSVFEKNGTFDEDLLFHEDTDFWFRAREKEIPILVQRKVALIYRMHGENLTHGENIKTMGFPNILFRSIRRRRQASEHIKPIHRLPNITEYKEKKRAGDRLQKPAEMRWPRISVILHVSPDQTKVDRSLESLSQQDYHPIELLIVGTEPDKARELAANLFDDITFVQVTATDLATQLNAALPKCTGEFISFLDTKDESIPGAIKTAAAHLVANPQDGIVVGRTRLVIQPDKKYPLELIDGVSMYKQVGALLGSIMLRRSILDKLGGFSTGLPGMEGFEWLLRAGDMGILHKALYAAFLCRFIQPENNEMATRPMQLAAIESVRRSIHRKRGSG